MEAIIYEITHYAYAQRALVASGLVGILCGVLGCFIVLRNMSLIGDALSHAILPGVVVAFLIAGHSVPAFFIGAIVAGLLAAVCITWIQQHVRTRHDAAIGIVFSAMFALGIMGISMVTRSEGVHLDMKDFLFGNVLGISSQDLWLTGSIALFVICCILLFYRFFFLSTFQASLAQTLGIPGGVIHYFLMLLLSFSVVASLQSVGVILVVAMLIIPASTAYLLTNRLWIMLLIAGGIGLISTTLGLLMAIALETTPGPAMTLVATMLYILAVLFAPQRGKVILFLKKAHQKATIIEDDLLKNAVKLYEIQQLTKSSLTTKLQFSNQQIGKALKRLEKSGHLTAKGDEITLKASGISRGYQTIRAHRLWESYLNQNTNLDHEQIHHEAERLEHALEEEFLQNIENAMGNPATDPHGENIPIAVGKPLQYFEPGTTIRIASRQEAEVMQQLWQANITPNKTVMYTALTASHLVLAVDGVETTFPVSWAQRILVSE